VAWVHSRLRQTRFSESQLSWLVLPLRIDRLLVSEVNIPEFLKGEYEHFL
jgi:hypothetical protein